MKVCRRCGLKKPFVDYNRMTKAKDGLQPWCRECHKASGRQHYRDHKPDYNRQARANSASHRDRARRLLWDYLLSNPCVDCGERDPVVLTFDHVRGRKTDNLSYMAGRGLANATLMAEIDKCEVRCANCHMRRTAKHLGWYQWSRTEVGEEAPC